MEVRRQIEWEHGLVERGVRRYRATLEKQTEDGGLVRKTLAETEPGMVIARDLLGPMVEQITAAQLQAVERMANPDLKKISDIDWILATLSAERMASVTVIKAMSYTDDAPFTGVARSVGSAIRDEYDFDRWKQAEAAAERDRKAVQSMTSVLHELTGLIRQLQAGPHQSAARPQRVQAQAPQVDDGRFLTVREWLDESNVQLPTSAAAQIGAGAWRVDAGQPRADPHDRR